MQGIDQFENELSQEIQKDLAQQDDDFVRSEVRRAEFFCNDLRRAANHMALVSLVTRLDHWTLKFVRLLSLTTKKASPTANPTSKLARHMEALNARLGNAPVSVEFFEEIVTARDSVIHADSQAEWDFSGTKRRVAARYVLSGELHFTDEDLTEAVEKVTTQIKWYDHAVVLPKSSTP